MNSDNATSALAQLLGETLAPTVKQAVGEAVARAVSEAIEAAERRERDGSLLSTSEAAKLASVHADTIRRAVKAGKLAAITSLGPVRFRRADVEALFASEAQE